MTPEKLKELEARNRKANEVLSEMRTLSDKAKAENRDFSDTEKERWMKMKNEHDRLVEESRRENDLEEIEKFTREREEKLNAVRGQDSSSQKREFSSLGEFVAEVAATRGYGKPSEKRALLTTEGSQGGFLIPTQFLPTILQVDPQAAIVRPYATVIPAGSIPDAEFTVPYFDQDDELGGVTPTRRATETSDMDESSPEFGLITLRPEEYSTFVDVSKKAVDNAPAISAFLEMRFRMSKNAKDDYNFLRGAAEARPEGIINATGVVEVDRNTSSDIKFADIAAMLAAQMDFAGARWIVNQSNLPKILSLADAEGNSIFIAGDVSKGIPPTLAGYPISWTSRLFNAGTKGDIAYVNLKYYLIKDGSGPFIEIYDVQPKKRLLTFTLAWNTDGQLWVKAPIEREDGNSYAPIVLLGTE